MSALQLARNIDCQHKTAFVLKHKVREAIAAETAGVTLSGTVEVDDAYFGGHIRPANPAEDLRVALAHPVSRNWKGYWQRARRT